MTERAKRLAAEFDRAFSEPVQALESRGDTLLSIMVRGAPYLLRIADIAAVDRAPRIVPLPNSSPIQLGIAGLRGSLVTVFSLAALLGLGGDNSTVHDAARANGWLAALARHRGMAIAFDAMDGQAELPSDAQAPNILDLEALFERGGIAR